MQCNALSFKPCIRANIFCIGMMLLANLEFALKPLGHALQREWSVVTKALKKSGFAAK
jgi:hypothetical protein